MWKRPFLFSRGHPFIFIKYNQGLRKQIALEGLLTKQFKQVFVEVVVAKIKMESRFFQRQ